MSSDRLGNGIEHHHDARDPRYEPQPAAPVPGVFVDRMINIVSRPPTRTQTQIASLEPA